MSHHDLAESNPRPPQRRQADQMQAIGRLAGGVAHDFNNLLTIINGYTELLTRRTAADDPLRPMLEKIRRAGLEATAVTRRLATPGNQPDSEAEFAALDDELPGGTETILLADDDPGVRSLARRVLAQCGYTVLEATRGSEAVEIARGHTGPIHLLVTDVVMPQLSGHETAERVRETHPGLKTLFVSGYPEGARGRTDGPCAFLQKPFSVRTFTRKVREVLDAGA